MLQSVWQVLLLLLCSEWSGGEDGTPNLQLAKPHRITGVLDNAAHRLAQSCCNTVLGSSKSDR